MKQFFLDFLHIYFPKVYIRVKHLVVLRKKGCFSPPETLPEKLLWLSITDYWDNEVIKALEDKFRVRTYLEEKGYGGLLTDLIGSWNNVDDIRWEDLPASYAMKLNVGSGCNIICHNNNIDVENAKAEIRKWMKKQPLYNRGKTFPFAIENTLAAVIESVMLPYFSRIQDEKKEFTDSLRFSMRMTAFIVAPIMFGLGATAEPLTVLLLTNKWIEIVPLIQIFSIGYTFGPISAVNLMAVNGIGRSDIYLKLEVIKRIIGIFILIISLKFGFIYVSVGLAVSFFINYLINVIPNIRILKYGLIQQIRDIIAPIAASAAMFVCIVLVNSKIQVGNILLIIIDVFLGVMIYTAISYVFNKKSLHWVIQEIKRRINEKNN